MSLADRDAPIDELWLRQAWRLQAKVLALSYEAAMADPVKRTLIRNHALELQKHAKRRAKRFDSKLAQLGEMQPEVD